MALFKFVGTKRELDQVDIHPGFVYVTSDGTEFDDQDNVLGEWYVDIGTQRYRLAAAALIDADGEVVNISDLVHKIDTLSVEQGGTGRDTITNNALLVGKVTQDAETGETVYGTEEIPATTGVLQAAAAGEKPIYGTVGLTMGGTGSTTAAGARSNLSVYSKEETDNEIKKQSAVRLYNGSEPYVLYGDAAHWIEDTENERFWQNVTVKGLTCGPNGDIPPQISIFDEVDTSKDKREELEEAYQLVYRAFANPAPNSDNSTIQFYATERPEVDIPLIIVDHR